MMTYDQTLITLDLFYDDCMEFWLNQGKGGREADALAIADVKAITTNPFSPNGDALDPKAKVDFLKLYDVQNA